MLLAPQFFSNRLSPRAAPHVHNAHNTLLVIDREEDAVHVRLPPVAHHPDGVVGVDAFRCNRTTLRMLVER